MKQNMQKMIAHSLLWSLLLNALLPAGLLAKSDAHCDKPHVKKTVYADEVNTGRLRVKGSAKVDGDLNVCDDAVVEGDLTVKGKIHGHCCDQVVDYIIIGMGASGAVMAKRLSDDKHTSVIGLEAGDNNNDEAPIYDPAFNLFLPSQFFPQYFWQGVGVPLPNVLNQAFPWTGGRLLGGGTSVNNIQVVRGSVGYWQEIEDQLGSDWSVDKTFKRFKKLETYIGPKGPGPNTRGNHGPWTNIALPETSTADSLYLRDAMVASTGYPEITDYNNPLTPFGTFLRWDMQERPGDLRESSAFAFLGSDVMTPEGVGVHGRKLRVHLRSTAIDLLWNKNKVIGVRYTQDGNVYEIFARKEVILSAGFQSAQFLQRNGVGPQDVLAQAGVPVRVNNPNIGYMKTHAVNLSILYSTPGANFIPDTETAFSFFAPGAFLPRNPGDTTRNMQWVPYPIAPDLLLVIALGPLLPKSTGFVAIQNDDPLKIPLANQGYFSDTDGPAGTSDDLNNTIEQFRLFLNGLSDYFAANPAPNGSIWTLIQPTPDVLNNDAALTDFILSTVHVAYHYTNLVPMGQDASTGAVDTHGRVFGVESLRVVDDSILPQIPDGNTATPAILVGWTISEFILAGE